MKAFVVCALFALVFVELTVCEDNVEHRAIEESADDKSTEALTDEVMASPKTKRGIFHHGYGAHGLTYNVPLPTAVYPHYGFQKPWHHVTYAKSPAVFAPNFIAPPPVHHHAVHHHPTLVHAAPAPVPAPVAPHLLISPGGATVTSYNVNYPRYPYYSKPHHHIDVPVAVARPAPTFFVQQPKPIIPVAVPAFSHRIPTLTRPTYHHVVQSLPAPAPVYPVAPVVPHVHAHQFVPIPLPAQPTVATFPTTFSTIPTLTTTSSVLPAGTHFVNTASAAPQQPADQWRPIFVSSQLPSPTPTTFATAAANRPAIGLLPPYGSAPAGVGASATSDQQALFHQQHQQQLELQHQYETQDYAEQQQFQPQVNQLYAEPADEQANQDFIQGIYFSDEPGKWI